MEKNTINTDYYKESLNHEIAKNASLPERISEKVEYTPGAENKTEFYIVSNGKHYLLVSINNLYTKKRITDCVVPIRRAMAVKYVASGMCEFYSIPYDTKHVLQVDVVNPVGKHATLGELLFKNKQTENGELIITCCEPVTQHREKEIEMDR